MNLVFISSNTNQMFTCLKDNMADNTAVEVRNRFLKMPCKNQ